MIIKSADDKDAQIITLKSLLVRPDVTADTRKRIEHEIRNIQAGIKGEREAAYEINFHYGTTKNWMIIHDLRIESGDRVAQIDHIVINRFMEIWVCESKHFSEGIAINEHGEFSAFYCNKPYGVPSPFEQNKKHILVLESVFKSGLVKLPSRLGFDILPSINSLILVSKTARITRPKSKNIGIDNIIKNDQFKTTMDRAIDNNNNPLMIAKMIGADTLEVFAKQLVQLHKPIEFNWHAKFGLSKEPLIESVQPKTAIDPAPIAAQANSLESKPKQKLVCHSCGAAVIYAVAKFCWFNKPKFGGYIYCKECQKNAVKL